MLVNFDIQIGGIEPSDLVYEGNEEERNYKRAFEATSEVVDVNDNVWFITDYGGLGIARLVVDGVVISDKDSEKSSIELLDEFKHENSMKELILSSLGRILQFKNIRHNKSKTTVYHKPLQ